MMKDIFLSVFEISVSASLVIFVLLVLSPYLNKRYAAKWKYLIWIAVALRLAIPFHFSLPDKALVINVPEQIITPIAVDTENEVPIVLNTEADLVEVTVLDMIAYLWGAGVVLFLSVHLLCYLHYKHQLIKNALPIEEDRILCQICRLSGELRIKSAIRVVRNFSTGSPMMIGFLKPVLVLADDNCSEEEMFFILKHELIHYKHHDVYFKLLFVTVNAIHWFNPLVYIMQREAVVDMELYCDESVIRQAGIAERKAYTEALLSTMDRQYKKGTALTTRFYGGRKIMKKRFQNVLLKSNKKNGWLACVCVVCLTLMSGAMVGCSAVKNLPSEVQAQTNLTDMTLPENGDTQTVLPVDHTDTLHELPKTDGADTHTNPENGDTQTVLPVDNTDTLHELPKTDGADTQTVLPVDNTDTLHELPEADGADTQTFPAQELDTNKNSGENLSADAREIKNIVEEFAAAYFEGDIDAMQKFLASTYEGEVDVYESTGTISDLTVKGFEKIIENGRCVVSLEFRDSSYEDMFLYLTVEFIKQEGSWKIQFYGVEG